MIQKGQTWVQKEPTFEEGDRQEITIQHVGEMYCLLQDGSIHIDTLLRDYEEVAPKAVPAGVIPVGTVWDLPQI
jgi:hypothetical protein